MLNGAAQKPPGTKKEKKKTKETEVSPSRETLAKRKGETSWQERGEKLTLKIHRLAREVRSYKGNGKLKQTGSAVCHKKDRGEVRRRKRSKGKPDRRGPWRGKKT